MYMCSYVNISLRIALFYFLWQTKVSCGVFFRGFLGVGEASSGQLGILELTLHWHFSSTFVGKLYHVQHVKHAGMFCLLSLINMLREYL